jgi:hypothetical protein
LSVTTRNDRAEEATMKDMRGMHARLDGLTSLVLDNPLLAAVAGIGFAVSFQTVARLARQHGMPGWPLLYPVGIDVGILALVAESRMLVMMKPPRSDLVPRVLAWALALFTVWANVHGSPAADWLGRGLHAVMPCLWIVFLELTRRRLVASQRADMIPFGRWVAAPLQTPRLWQRMHRDDVRSWPLALELEHARLHARDLVRAAPDGHRPPRSSLLCKRVRSGRLPEAVRRAVAASMVNDWAPGWEEAVTAWVTTALAIPGHLAASLDGAFAATPVPIPVASDADTIVATASAPPVAMAKDTPTVAAKAPAKSRPLVPSKATDDELAELVLPLLDGPDPVTRYKVVKTIREAAGGKAGIGDDRADRIMDLARRKRVVPIEARRRA